VPDLRLLRFCASNREIALDTRSVRDTVSFVDRNPTQDQEQIIREFQEKNRLIKDQAQAQMLAAHQRQEVFGLFTAAIVGYSGWYHDPDEVVKKALEVSEKGKKAFEEMYAGKR